MRGTGTCAATAACRTPASAWASSAPSPTSRSSPTCATRSPSRARRAMRSTDFYIACVVILIVGFTSAGIIYATADERDSAAMDQIYGSKPYVRELQRFGGKASVLFDEFQRWFAGLWLGQTLGVTIASLTAFVALVVFLVSRAHARAEKSGP